MKSLHPSPSWPASLSFLFLSFPPSFSPCILPSAPCSDNSHADQIHAETVFCSCGQFSLYGPDKSRHCTITGHKSLSVSCCAEMMNYWTGGKSVHMGMHAGANIHKDTYLGTHLPHHRILLSITKLLRVTWEKADHDRLLFVICIQLHQTKCFKNITKYFQAYLFLVHLSLDMVFTVALRRTFLHGIPEQRKMYQSNLYGHQNINTPYNQ